MSNNRRKSSAMAEKDEVEKLLQVAQDEMLLKLSVNSHMSHVAPDYLDPDLHQRFQALRSRPSASQSKPKPQQRKQPSSAAEAPKAQPPQKEGEEKEETQSKVFDMDNVDEELRGVLGDDLSARFAALKASLSCSTNQTPAITTNEVRIEKSDGDDEEDEVEVEKVIQWAMDAARLDPSPLSDEDDDHIYSDDDDDTDYDEDDHHRKNKKKESKSWKK